MEGKPAINRSYLTMVGGWRLIGLKLIVVFDSSVQNDYTQVYKENSGVEMGAKRP